MASERLDAVQVETGPAPRASVIWLHGLGADGNDFAPIVSELQLPLPVRFVFPHAPMRPVSINWGSVMRAWYDIVERNGDWEAVEPDIRESQRQIEALIDQEKKRGFAAARILLAGFSQGGAMALHTGLRHPDRLAGIMALSCTLPLAETLPAEGSPANRDVPIFMAHGTHDDLIPLERARRSRDVLIELGYRVTWREYRMAHAVCPEEIADIAAWLRGVLAAV